MQRDFTAIYENSIERTEYSVCLQHISNPVQGSRVGIWLSGLYKTGMFYQSVHGRIHSGAESQSHDPHNIEICSDLLRTYVFVS